LVEEPAFRVSLFAGKYYYWAAVLINSKRKWMDVVCSAKAMISKSQM
jgi:hypothetical protein